VLVYVGAVMVLFLFVVMMLDVNFDSLRQHFRSYLPIGVAVGALVLFEMALVIVDSAIGRTSTAPAAPTGSNTVALGRLLYVDYVYPFEIEQVILSHPAVQDCAVIGVPDDKWGEAIKAVVELKTGRSVPAEDLIALCKERLGSVKTPKSVEFSESLPRSPVGKVMRRAVRDKYWSGKSRQV